MGRSQHENLSSDVTWDFVVIGGGTAGLVASRTAATFGVRVLLVERDRLGGDCLWTGCVPSKSLIAAAHAASTARYSEALGVRSRGVTVDFAAVMAHVHGAMQTIAPVDSTESLGGAGVAVMHGDAHFINETTLRIDDTVIRFRQALIATGATPCVPASEGADSIDFLTSETVWDLRDQPRHLVVIGGGAIGSELSQAMARLGSRVTLIQRGDRLIPRESAAASALIRDALVADGVNVLTGRTVARFLSDDRMRGSLTLDDGTELDFDRVLAAIGRAPNSGGLGLGNANVEVDSRGNVAVTDSLRTSNPRIWAAGDVTALPQFTHTAGVNGSIAASNAILGLRRTIDRRAVPRVTFTHPEVASVGVSADDADPGRHRVVTIDHAHLDRAIAEAETIGFTQIVTDRKGTILGTTIVGPRAGETLGEVTLAVRNALTAGQVAGTTHAYPTYSDAFWNACVSIVRSRLGSGAMRRTIRVLASIRRMRLG